MQALIEVILPVFLIIAFGYIAVWRNLFSHAHIDGVMAFAQSVAIPCLLFRAIATLDLHQTFNLKLLGSFYIGALSGFIIAMVGARVLFSRPWEDSIAIGFLGLFSNSVLLGLPITERAFGSDMLSANYAIIAFHSPFCYTIGISAMSVARAYGANGAQSNARLRQGMTVITTTFTSILRNPLILGILAGFAVNLLDIQIPAVGMDALDMVVATALPAALFGLGGVLVRYQPEGDWRIVAFVCAISLIIHPTITYLLTQATDLPVATQRSAVITAAMATGINGYIFANMYGVAKRVAATSVLVGTAFTLVTAWIWLIILA